MPSPLLDLLWRLPEQSPEDEPLVCIALNKQWVSILAGALDALTDTSNWYYVTEDDKQRIISETNAIVAAISEAGECGVSCIQFRVNPANPACIQVSCDNGTTWTDAWCGNNPTQGAMQRYDQNGHFEYSLDGGSNWRNADNLDQRFNSPSPQGHIGTDAACRAATSCALVATKLKEEIATALTSTGVFLAIVGAIAAFIGDVFGFVVPPTLVAALVSGITYLTVTQWNETMSEEIFHQFQCILYCVLGDGSAPTPTLFTSQMYDEILAHVRAEFDLVPRLFFEAWVYLLGPVGLQVASVQQANDGDTCGDCACADCTPVTYNWYTDAPPNTTGWTLLTADDIAPGQLNACGDDRVEYIFDLNYNFDGHMILSAGGTQNLKAIGAWYPVPTNCLVEYVHATGKSDDISSLPWRLKIWADFGSGFEFLQESNNFDPLNENPIFADFLPVTGALKIAVIAYGGLPAHVGRLTLGFG